MNNTPDLPEPEPSGRLDIHLTNGQHMRFIDTMPVLRDAYDSVVHGIDTNAFRAVRLTFTEGPALVLLDHITAAVLRED